MKMHWLSKIMFVLIIVVISAPFGVRGTPVSAANSMLIGMTAPASPKPIVNINYYVDAVSGNDANNGTSPATAWRTLERIRQTKYGPGNKIFLHRGQSWLDQVLYIGNGRNELEEYLSGFSIADPTSVTMANLRNANIPELTYGTIEDVLPLDLTSNTIPESMVEFGSYGDSNSPNPLVKNVSIHWTTGIYIHDIDAFKNGTEYTTIMQHNMNIVLKDYKTPGMYTDYSNNVRIKNMLSETSHEHGLYLCHQSANFIVEDSIFRNNAGHGIQTNGENTNPNPTDAIVIKYSKIYGNTGQGNGGVGYNDVRSRNIIFYRNLMVSGGYDGGKALEIGEANSDNQYYHNVIVSRVPGRPAVGTGNVHNTFVNNIFYVQDEAIVNPRSVFSSDYSDYYAVLPANHIPTFDWGNTYAWWKTNTGNDAHSIAADPLFVYLDINGDPDSWDLHLRSTSPAIDKGTVISATLGESYTFLGSGPDIGMYEYAPSLTLSGSAANQAIHLNWEILASLSATSTWQITYDGLTGDQVSPITGIISSTQSYTLTGLTNYTWYTVTLSAMLGATPILTDTVYLMPTDHLLFVPIIQNR